LAQIIKLGIRQVHLNPAMLLHHPHQAGPRRLRSFDIRTRAAPIVRTEQGREKLWSAAALILIFHQAGGASWQSSSEMI
jgi:hypothetical protein